MQTRDTTEQSNLLKRYIEQNINHDFAIFSSTIDMVLVMDLGGKIEYASETFLDFTGIAKDLEGMKLQDFILPIFLNSRQSFFRGKTQEKLENFDLQIQSTKGQIADVNITTIPILYQGELIGSYIVFKDISSLKKNRVLTLDREKQYNNVISKLAQLAEKQAAAGQLAAGIAHEIRNPITAIKGFLQLQLEENHRNKLYYEIIHSEIERVEIILKELLVLAKPTQQKFEKINVQLLLEQVLTLMESQAVLNNIQVKNEYQFLNVEVLGDPNQLKQVFINYIKNAIEAMPFGGELILKGCLYQGSHVQINILDQGPGISREIQAQIGEPFFTTKENGTGLGMLVSDQILKEHKGNMNILSNENGTCIQVNLPVIERF